MTLEQYEKNLSVPTGTVDVILDTDAYNEVDDQFAIAYMLLAKEKIRPLGITAAPFLNARSTSPADGMEKSYREILKILDLLGEMPLKEHVYRGSERFLPSEREPVPSPAAAFIAETAAKHTPEHPLYVVAIGAITNVASAILLQPEVMRENTVVVWLGGHSHGWVNTEEFNMRQDIAAARVVFDGGMPLVQLPCEGVVSEFRTTKPELLHWLKGTTPVADYLAENTIRQADLYAEGRAWSRCIWDVTAVAWLLNENDRFMSSAVVPAPVPEYDFRYAFDFRRRPMRYVYHIWRDNLFSDLFFRLSGRKTET